MSFSYWTSYLSCFFGSIMLCHDHKTSNTAGKAITHTHITLFVLTVWFLKMEFRTSFSNRSANAYGVWKEEVLSQTLAEKNALGNAQVNTIGLVTIKKRACIHVSVINTVINIMCINQPSQFVLKMLWKHIILLMEEILHKLIGGLSHYLQGFIHPRWCRISSINSIIHPLHLGVCLPALGFSLRSPPLVGPPRHGATALWRWPQQS